MNRFANIELIPSPQCWLNPPSSANFIPSGAKYNGNGQILLSVVRGAIYIWTGTGGETCLNDGNPEVSGVDFVADSYFLLLTGTPNDFVFATVVRAYR